MTRVFSGRVPPDASSAAVRIRRTSENIDRLIDDAPVNSANRSGTTSAAACGAVTSRRTSFALSCSSNCFEPRPMRIGTLAQRTGTNVPTVRYYESIGLLPRATRQEGGHRLYGESDVERLTFIRRCREFGFSVEQVRSLVALGRDRSRSCLELRDVAATHLSDVRARIRQLEGLAQSLETFVETCDTMCPGGAGPDCTILEDLRKASSRCSYGERV
jgi:DNA-binding transcriptional MerR regulator